MKKKIIFIMLAVSVVLYFSCKRNEETAPRIEASTGNEPTPVVVSSIINPGFALVVNTGLYILDGDDTGDETTGVRWGAAMSLGEPLLIGEPRQLTFTGNGNVLNFIEVRRDNRTEGWALASQVAAGGRLAVVIEERTFLHAQPRTVEISSFILSRRSVVIYYPETESNGFVEVRGWDVGRQAFVQQNNNFVRLSSLSRRDSDIQSAILLHTALSITAANQADRREALLEAALLYQDSVFHAEIFEILHPNTVGVILNEHEDLF
jgi:hypothetical protein